jgi:hypothetical protein
MADISGSRISEYEDSSLWDIAPCSLVVDLTFQMCILRSDNGGIKIPSKRQLISTELTALYSRNLPSSYNK